MEAFAVHSYTRPGCKRDATTATTADTATFCGGVTASTTVSASAIRSYNRITVAGTPIGGGDEIGDAAGRIGVGGTNETKVEW